MSASRLIWEVDEEGFYGPFLVDVRGEKQKVTWAPQPGSQEAFLACPVLECLYQGSRGPGKTDALLMDFAQHVGQGWGREWKGILFRRTYPELEDVIQKSLKWFPQLFPKARFTSSPNPEWTFPDGEKLYFRNIKNVDGYWDYHGHCVKNTSQVLTPDGWRGIADIKIGDAVYTVTKDRRLVPMRVATTTEQDYDGDMIVHEGRGTFMEFTPGHGLGLVGSDGELSHTKYEDCGYEIVVGAHATFDGGEELREFTVPAQPKTRRHKVQPLTVTGDQFAEFMGWFLSEGSAPEANLQVQIAQTKPEGRETISALLRGMGNSLDWHTYLKQFGHCRDKYVPEEIKRTSARQLRIFFDAAMAGDGTKQGDNSYYFTTSRHLADDMSEIAVKLGYKVTVSERLRKDREGLSYTVACRAGARRDIRLRTDARQRKRKLSRRVQIRREHYKGKVYCIGLPKHHLFMIRQQGSVWISGNSYPWVAWEELTTWPDDKCYLMMMSVCRSTTPGMPRKYRSTTNPYGRGHNWVRARFQLPIRKGVIVGKVIRDTDEDGTINERVSIHGRLAENKVLLHADPGYRARLRQSTTNESMERAWMDGDWDIVAGGMFDDIWDKDLHFITPFEIPNGWIIDRSLDWGSSRPFSVGWYAVSDGTDVPGFGPTQRGDIFRIAEWYGWTGNTDEGCRMTASQVATGIKERERAIFGNRKIRPGPADSQIWAKDTDESIAQLMAKHGVYWTKASKGPGSRELGWQRIRDMLLAAKQGSREEPGFFVFDCCEQFLRTVPSLSRDARKIDDVDVESEDHVGDEVRYRLFTRPSRMGVKNDFQGR